MSQQQEDPHESAEWEDAKEAPPPGSGVDGDVAEGELVEIEELLEEVGEAFDDDFGAEAEEGAAPADGWFDAPQAHEDPRETEGWERDK